MQPQQLEQTGAQTFTITWRDGLVMEYDLVTLQRECPCAQCRKTRRDIPKDVMISSIETKGRYGLVFSFTSGCTKGVYTYSMLRRLGRAQGK